MLFLPVVPQQQRRCVSARAFVASKDTGSTGGAGIESVASCAGPPARRSSARMVNTMRCQPRAKSNTIDCYVSMYPEQRWRHPWGTSLKAFPSDVPKGRQLTYVVDENCVRCKIMDCVEVCPVDCFYEGENMLVIHPDECIDSGVCVRNAQLTRSNRTLSRG